MPFAAALSTASPAADALAEVAAASAGLGGPADLAVLFFSPHHAGFAEDLAAGVRERLAPRRLIGCVGESILGNDREVEGKPALALWLAKWSRPVEVEAFHLELE